MSHRSTRTAIVLLVVLSFVLSCLGAIRPASARTAHHLWQSGHGYHHHRTRRNRHRRTAFRRVAFRRVAFRKHFRRTHHASLAVLQARRHYLRGEKLAFRGDTDGAIREWQMALGLKPGSFVTEQELSRALAHRDALADARETENRALTTPVLVAEADFRSIIGPVGDSVPPATSSGQAPHSAPYQLAFRTDGTASSSGGPESRVANEPRVTVSPAGPLNVAAQTDNLSTTSQDLTSARTQVALVDHHFAKEG